MAAKEILIKFYSVCQRALYIRPCKQTSVHKPRPIWFLFWLEVQVYARGDRRKPKTRCEYLIKQTICERLSFFLPLPRVLLLFCNRSLPKKQLSHNFNIFTYKATVKLADSNHYHRAAKLLCVPWPRWSMKLMPVRKKKTAQRMFEKRYALKSLVFYGEDKTVIYGTSHSSRERERNNRSACLHAESECGTEILRKNNRTPVITPRV